MVECTLDTEKLLSRNYSWLRVSITPTGDIGEFQLWGFGGGSKHLLSDMEACYTTFDDGHIVFRLPPELVEEVLKQEGVWPA